MGKFPRKSDGFTLLEMSIVLVIIGLIIGAILGGAELVEAYRMRAIGSEIGKYTAAFNTFKVKYNYLPGDFPDAESIWGADAACPATPSNTVPKQATCDGTGDGAIAPLVAQYYESFRAWQQLANAEMIEGAYTGVAGPAGNIQPLRGVNVPTSKWPDGHHEIWHRALSAGDASFYAAKYGHFFYFGGDDGVTNAATAILTPLEAYELDAKLDDGRPGYGKIVVGKPAIMPNCATNADPAVAVYDTATTTPTCLPLIITGF